MSDQDRFTLDWDLSSARPRSTSLNQDQDHKHGEENEELCAVCLSKGEDTMLLPCAHQFHGKCILRWVDQNFSCPLCRQEISQFVPLNTNDPEIHKQFVDIWERHHYGGNTEDASEKEDYATENDRFSVSKQKEISLSEVAALEETSVDVESNEPVSVGANTRSDSSGEESKRAAEEDITLTEEQIHSVAEEIVDSQVVDILLDVSPSRYSTLVLKRPQLSAHTPRSLHFGYVPQDGINIAVHQALTTAGEEIWKQGVHITRSLLAAGAQQKNRDDNNDEVVKIRIKTPTLYKLNESLEAGFLSGCLTASLLTVTTRPANLYPLFREVVPNVAIFFTVYEDLKSRNMDPNTDTKVDSFLKRTVCAGAAATVGHLPQNRFKVTVPVRFGLQFGFFELFKDNLCVRNGDETKDHSKLSPAAIGASALCGGVLAATSAFPVELYMKYMSRGEATYLASYQLFMKRFTPGCVFTALSFEFGRRWIHSKDAYDDDQ